MNSTVARLFCLPALLTMVACSGEPLTEPTEPYHILLTNDDGIASPGIQILAEKLGAVGEVHLVAPCGQQSGASMSVALGQTLNLRLPDPAGPNRGHCVDTTPAGAAILAITTLAPEGGFDLVVSGINRGANVGTSSHMSGTVGGAMAGALYGLPAVAASMGGSGRDFDYSASFVARFVEDLKLRPAMPGIVFSINIPHPSQGDLSGATFAKMGGSHLRFGYEEVEGQPGYRRFRPRIEQETRSPEGSDTEAFMRDMITVTPLMFDWTAYPVLDGLKNWNLSHELQH